MSRSTIFLISCLKRRHFGLLDAEQFGRFRLGAAALLEHVDHLRAKRGPGVKLLRIFEAEVGKHVAAATLELDRRQRNSTRNCRPSALAASSKVFSCTVVFSGSSRRSSCERLDFQKAKADWVQDRLKKGYEGDIEKLWATAQQQNAEAAAVKRLDLLLDAQRRQVAHHAGEHWRPLLDYLSGKLRALPEG